MRRRGYLRRGHECAPWPEPPDADPARPQPRPARAPAPARPRGRAARWRRSPTSWRCRRRSRRRRTSGSGRRLAGFDPAELDALHTSRAVVRGWLHAQHAPCSPPGLPRAPRRCSRPSRAPRSSAGSGARWRPSTSTSWAPRRARSPAAEPTGMAAIGRALAPRWPDVDLRVLGYAAGVTAHVVQIPPRGLWRDNRRPRLVPAEPYLGAPLAAGPDAGALVLRYLRRVRPGLARRPARLVGAHRRGRVLERLAPQLRARPRRRRARALRRAGRAARRIPRPRRRSASCPCSTTRSSPTTTARGSSPTGTRRGSPTSRPCSSTASPPALGGSPTGSSTWRCSRRSRDTPAARGEGDGCSRSRRTPPARGVASRSARAAGG